MASDDPWAVDGKKHLREALAGAEVNKDNKTVTLRSGEVWRSVADLRKWHLQQVERLEADFHARANFEGGEPVQDFNADDLVDEMLSEAGIDLSLFD